MKLLPLFITTLTIGLSTQNAETAISSAVPAFTFPNTPLITTQSVSLPSISTVLTSSLGAPTAVCATQLRECVAAGRKAGLSGFEINSLWYVVGRLPYAF